jgi:hypothetical protein
MPLAFPVSVHRRRRLPPGRVGLENDFIKHREACLPALMADRRNYAEEDRRIGMAELRDLVCTDRDLVKPCSIATGENVTVSFDAAFGVLRSRYSVHNHQKGRIGQVQCRERKRGNPVGYP